MSQANVLHYGMGFAICSSGLAMSFGNCAAISQFSQSLTALLGIATVK